MASGSSSLHNDLFSSLISDIKTYTGKDPLLPWLRGIRKVRECLPPQILKQKLPRFLQKCARTFETDRRYTNDLRYLRVWLQLMDFVDDPKAVLKTMEANHIGTKRSLFYQAYALYYEKVKKFDDAEKMYRLGVKNLAEPIGELQKSYEQFLHRMERHMNKRVQRQEARTAKRPLGAGSLPHKCDESNGNKENLCIECRPKGAQSEESLPVKQCNVVNVENKNGRPVQEPNCTRVAVNTFHEESSKPVKNVVTGYFGNRSYVKLRDDTEAGRDEPRKFCGEDTVVVKFVDTAIVGKSEAEDACHHGLVEPTINTKEALNAINSMFQEPLEPPIDGRRSCRSRPKTNQSLSNGFEVFIDDNMDNEIGSLNQNMEKGNLMLQHNMSRACQPPHEPLQIYVDDEESNEVQGVFTEKINSEPKSKGQQMTEITPFVFPSPNDISTEGSEDQNAERSPRARVREDTVVRRFVGSTILDEPEVENVCHHGLVEPTINLKEAMDDINSMFGKPIDFVRTKRSKKKDKAADTKNNWGGFVILPDDDLDCQKRQSRASSSAKREYDLFEPTICTKEALDDINKMFGMPLDF